MAPSQQRLMVAGVVAAHIAGVWALLQVPAVREAVADVAPMIFNIVQPEAPKPPPPPPQPPKPVLRKAPTPLPVVAAPPSPAPAAFVVPVQPEPQPAPPEPVVVQAPPAPPAPPPPPPPPRTISATEVQFLKTPTLDYPVASRRARESGRVVLRFFIDDRGMPRNVQINRSSGFPRLDDAAVAAIQRALFRPYSENGQAIGVWAVIPLDFDLEK